MHVLNSATVLELTASTLMVCPDYFGSFISNGTNCRPIHYFVFSGMPPPSQYFISIYFVYLPDIHEKIELDDILQSSINKTNIK